MPAKLPKVQSLGVGHGAVWLIYVLYRIYKHVYYDEITLAMWSNLAYELDLKLAPA